MSQDPMIDSEIQFPKTARLNPALASALASLEVQLDQELTRYRRTRNGMKKSSGIEFPQPNSTQSVWTESTSQTSHRTDSSISINTILDQTANTNTADNNAALVNSPRSSLAINLNDVPLESSNNSSHTAFADSVTISPQVPPTENSFLAENSPLQPDDYLESSEALLRSLTSEPLKTSQPEANKDGLLSPLGISSMVLLVMSSLILGYVVVNSSLPKLDLAKLFHWNSHWNFSSTSNRQAATNSSHVLSNVSSLPQVDLTPISKHPDLATREFPDLRDPSDVANMKPITQPQLSTNTRRNASTIQQPIQQPIESLNPIPLPTLPPFTVSKETTGTQLKPPLKPSSDGFYHIIANYQGKGDLLAARTVVRDAYLSPNRKYIYLGTLNTEAEAQQRLRKLESKGIKARVQSY
jgi:hypothetical protein